MVSNRAVVADMIAAPQDDVIADPGEGLEDVLLQDEAVLAERLGDMMERAREGGASVAVLSIDLDSFKVVNDVHGHPAGDGLLVRVAQRLRAVTRGRDLVAELGWRRRVEPTPR